jgi:HAD superfamily hydrolase (TIGR01509 family)
MNPVEQSRQTARNFRPDSIQAVLFDLDGVVIDSEPVHERSLVVASERLGHKLTHTELVQLKGLNQEASAAGLKSLASRTDVSSAEIIRMRSEVFAQLIDNVQVMPHVLEFIHRLRASGLSVALTTSSGGSALGMIFARFGLFECFDVVVTGDHVTHSKPHPEPYRLTTERLGVKSNVCLAIEDSVNGIISATLAGCYTVRLTTSFSKQILVGAGALFSIDNFEELEPIMFPTAPSLSAAI